MITAAKRAALTKYKKSERGKEINRAYLRRKNQRKRLICLKHYSGEIPHCACCGENHIEFLAIDHIKGGGNKHRREINCSSGSHFYRWLIQHNFPEGFRVLCNNCNGSLGHYGYCPHQINI